MSENKSSPKNQNAIRLLKYSVDSLKYKNVEAFDGKVDLEKLEVSIGYGLSFNKKNKKFYSVTFEIEIASDNIQLELVATGFFSSKNKIEADFKESPFLTTNSPAILFPYLRSYITTLTTQSGVDPIILPTFNFSN